MNRQKLNRIISLVLNAIKKEQGIRREYLKNCVTFLNRSRFLLKQQKDELSRVAAEIAFEFLKLARAA